MQTLYTNNLEETHALGKKIGSLVKENMVILLNGDLGAGKTSLTQGIAKGLGITRNVTSPTFNILKIYYGRMALYHIDAYRLENSDEDLTVIEWSEFVPELIPDHYLSISISLCEGDKRQFVFEANGKEYESLLEEIVC